MSVPTVNDTLRPAVPQPAPALLEHWDTDVVPHLPAALAAAALPGGVQRIWLIDGSTVPQPGGPLDAWRLHSAYDWRAGRLGWLTLTDHHHAEGLAQFPLAAGDLAVADRGYGYRKHLVA